MLNWDLTKVVVLLSALLFSGLFVWLQSALVAPAMRLASHDATTPDYYLRDFTVTAMDVHGQPKYTLQAQSLVHYPNDQNTRLEHPHLVQFRPQPGSDARIPVVTTADTGFISSDGKHLIMKGNVNVEQGKGVNLPSGELHTQQLDVLLD